MRTALLAALLVAPLVLAPTALASIQWMPVCHDKEVTVARTTVHVGVDCERGIWISHCPPVGDGPCRFIAVEDLLA